jgi:hypothetical protein
MVPAEELDADFGREDRWLCLDRAALPGLPVAETEALLPCIMASALATGSRRTAVVDHARLLQPYDGSSCTRCGHSHFMRNGQGRGCRRPDWKMFCNTSCGRRPGVRFGSLIAYANAASRAVVRRAISSATARRNNVHSVRSPECGARQLVSVCSFLAESRAYRRLGCGWIVWIWVVRLVWWRVVSCRVVRGGIVIRMVGGWSNGGRGRHAGGWTPECYPCAG